MQTRRYKSVTIPVLVPCAVKEMDGVWGSQPVRVFTKEALVKAVKARLIRPADAQMLHAYKLLKQAKELKDEAAEHVAKRMLEDASHDAAKAAELLAPHVQWASPDADTERTRSIRTGLLAFDALNDASLLTALMTKTIDRSRDVFWSPAKEGSQEATVIYTGEIRQGHFCPDVLTAYAHKLLWNGLRVCLRCYEIFVPTRPRQQCCSRQHAEVHRVTRWRFNNPDWYKNSKKSKKARRGHARRKTN